MRNSEKDLNRMENPYFETQRDQETGFSTKTVMAVEGGTAVLACKVRNLRENHTVSFAFIHCLFL